MTPGVELIVEEGTARLEYIPGFFSFSLFEPLCQTIEWKQNHLKIFGKTHAEPRLTAWFGPAYSYSGIKWPEAPIPDVLQPTLLELNRFCRFNFNSVLINYYRDGQDSMGWHRDNEPEMDQRIIASASFGCDRVFRFRRRRSSVSNHITLSDGSLLLMHNFQQDWEHMVPKSRKVDGARINLTFRRWV